MEHRLSITKKVPKSRLSAPELAENRETPPPARRRAGKLNPEARRAQLLSCAVRAFALHGLDNASHAQVAQVAHVSVPTIFAYFPTRDALVEAVLGEVEAQMMAIVHRDDGRPELSVFDRILDILVGYADEFTRQPDIIRIFLSWSTCYHGEKGRLFQVYNDRIRQTFFDLLQHGIKSGELPDRLDCKYSTLIILGSTSIIAQMKYWSATAGEVEGYLRALLNAALDPSA